MEFKMRTAEEMRDKMVGWVRSTTTRIKSFRVGSVIVALLEACAVIVEDLYYDIFQATKSAIETSVYSSFGFSKITPQKSTGYATFSRSTVASQNYPIPIGTVVSTEGSVVNSEVQFETIEAGTLNIGDTSVILKIRAVAAGTLGDVAEDSINMLVSKPAGIESVINETPTSGGRDEETISQLRDRFVSYLNSKYRGTAEALEYAAIDIAGSYEAFAEDNPDLFVLLYDGADFRDESLSLTNPYQIPVGVFSDPLTVQKSFYVGCRSKHSFTYINLSTPGVGALGDVIWEYYKEDGTWGTLNITSDGTSALKQSGIVSYTTPFDWCPVVTFGYWAFWIRCRVSNTGYSTLPVANFMFVNPPPGFVDLYVIDSNGNAGQTLLDSVKDTMITYRGAGITINIKAGVKDLVDVTVYVVASSGYTESDLKAGIQSSVETYLSAFKMNQVLWYDELYQQIKGYDNGYAVKRMVSLLPSKDVYPCSGHFLRAGVVTVEVVK